MRQVGVAARNFCFDSFHDLWLSIKASVYFALVPAIYSSLSNNGLEPALFSCGQFGIIIAHYHKTAALDQNGSGRVCFYLQNQLKKSRQALSVSRGRLAGSF